MMTNSEHDTLLALATSPDFKKDKLAFAGRHSGLYRSCDAGKTWNAVSIIKGEALSVTALACSPGFISDGLIFAALPGGVAYSSDSGDTWYWSQLATPSPYVTSLVVSPNFEENKTLFAATLEDGIFRSVNGGGTWESWNFGLLDKQTLCLAINRESVYAGTSTGFFHSHNDGRSWREVALPVEDSVLSLGVIGEYLLVGTETHGLFISIDGMKSWKQIKAKGLHKSINQIQALEGKKMLIRVVAGNALMESKDEGKTWQKLPLPSLDEPVLLATPFVGFSSGLVIKCK